MKAFGKIVLGTVLASTLVAGSMAKANQSIAIGNISITGGGLQLVGTISTMSLADKHVAFTYVGWGLIVVGALIDNKDLVISAGHSETLQASQVWGAMTRQAKVIAANPALAQDDVEIANAAKAMKLDVHELAQAVIDLDGSVPAKDVEAKYFPNGFQGPVQHQAFNNLTALASMK